MSSKSKKKDNKKKEPAWERMLLGSVRELISLPSGEVVAKLTPDQLQLLQVVDPLEVEVWRQGMPTVAFTANVSGYEVNAKTKRVSFLEIDVIPEYGDGSVTMRVPVDMFGQVRETMSDIDEINSKISSKKKK